ncbi:ATP-dependent helicase fft2 [Escovopsis weberi]|uniref:ATP-dependent helicase fft2 n=1 Tax=Escovopsis weberi TaxID=150374 RepID=A0A0M8MXT0_ESCWE|nr:ATP-dependent helicase fft2 [Escovopsis weberi]
MDELAGDTVPCSPLDRLERDTTQPTQVLSRPPLTLEQPSSPASVIEVPASSPFQPPKQAARIGSRLAPAGTLFRPPTRPAPPAAKAGASPELICLESDDDDDDNDDDDDDDDDDDHGKNVKDDKKNLMAPRGDIRPTTFKAQMAAFKYRPADDKEMSAKLRQIFDVLGTRIPSDKVRDALRKNNLDIHDTIAMLESQDMVQRKKGDVAQWRAQMARSGSPGAQPAARPDSKPAIKSRAKLQAMRKPAPTPESPTAPPPQPPARRRLVQGLRKRKASSPEAVEQDEQQIEDEVAHSSGSEDPLVVDLVDNDREDAYQAELSPSPLDFGDDRVLRCINDSTLKDLAAITGIKEVLLEPMIEKRPFASLSQARRVTAGKKGVGRKSAKVCIGETAVDAVEVFLDAVEAIDKVVAKCEAKGRAINEVVGSWDLDAFGQMKRASPEGDLPPTPNSFSGSKPARLLVPRQPQLMDGHCVMKPFQLFGLNWMSVLYNYDIGCILADEMGLGKTCQVISFICQLVQTHEKQPSQELPWPNLIVVPPSTYNNWLAEFKRFAPGLSVVGYRGTQTERAETAMMVHQDPEAYHVVLATYSQINCEDDIDAMGSFGLNAAIFDEGHKMKNPETKTYRDLRRIPAAWKMLLTGTPVQNNLLEMTSLLNFINPRLFDGCMDQIQYIFSQKVTVRDVSNGAFLYSERVRRARTILEPFILQRRKDQVLSDMPRKTCTVVRCEMSAAQRAAYDEYEALFRLPASQRGARAAGRSNDQNNVWVQLRKAALHPLLFRRHFTSAKVEQMARILMDGVPQSELHQPDLHYLTEELKNSSDFGLHLWCRDYRALLGAFDIPPAAHLDSGKVRALLALVERYRANGDRTLVFSKFSSLVDLLSEVLARQDVPHLVLQGNTDVSERQRLIDAFNQDPAIPVFLLTTGAGGTGINLTAANKVVIFDQSDNPQDDIQAENRAHRLGQTRDVEVVRLIAARSVEELILTACRKKIELADKVTGAADEAARDVAQNLEKEVRKMMMGMTPP